MDSLKRNQLAEIIVQDGQPVRAIANYLIETMETLKGFDCVTDYYSESKGNLLDLENHPVNRPNIKMTNELFNDFLRTAVNEITGSIYESVKIDDLYLHFDYEEDDEGDDDFGVIGYYLTTDKGRDGIMNFLVKFTDIKPPVVATIDIRCLPENSHNHEFEKFSDFIENYKSYRDPFICFSVNESDYCFDYDDPTIDSIIPIQ